MNGIEEIIGLVGMAAAGLGTVIARWTQTNPARPWYVRLSRVFDATQVIDSTRKLDDE